MSCSLFLFFCFIDQTNDILVVRDRYQKYYGVLMNHLIFGGDILDTTVLSLSFHAPLPPTPQKKSKHSGLCQE